MGNLAGKFIPYMLNGDGESYALGVLDDHGVYSQDLAFLVDQRTTAVARIDGSVGLDYHPVAVVPVT